MAPDPPALLPGASGATTATGMPPVAPVGGAGLHARREASAASFAGSLQAVLAQPGKAAAVSVASDPVAGTTETGAAAPGPGLAAPPVAAVAAKLTPQDRAPAGKARGPATSAGLPAARSPGPGPTGAPIADTQPPGLPQPILVTLSSVPLQPAAPSAQPLDLPRAEAAAAATSATQPGPAVPAELDWPGAGREMPQANAALVPVAATPAMAAETAPVLAAIPTAAEATAAGITMPAPIAGPTIHAEKPGLADNPVASPGFPAGSPAQQVAPALLLLGNAGGHSAPGMQRLTLRLDPAALGQVEIRIDRLTSGPAEIRIAAERPETLVLLQHDRHQLDIALDQAGIPAARQIDFQITPRIQPAGTGDASAGAWDGTRNGGGQSGSGEGHGDAGRQGSAGRTQAGISSAAPGWLRAGVDITA